MRRQSLDPHHEDGIALIVVLGILLVLTVTTVTAVQMTTSTQSTTADSAARQAAGEFAEGGVNNAEAILNYDISNNINPTTPTNFGCGTGTGGASDCSTHTASTVCIETSTCTSGTAATASVYGFFTGTNPGTYDGQSVAASTWLIISTGYANGASATTVSATRMATIKVSALTSGSVAAVWNHVFLTAPYVAGVCQTSITGNSITINAPIYSIGNFCLSSNNESIVQNTQPVDIQIGGKLVLSNLSNDFVGSTATPLNSGVVVGGCATSVTATPVACSTWTTNYHVGGADTWSSQDAPTETAADIASDYSSFDPGPSHGCQTGNHPYAPLTSAVFDGNATQDDSAGTFELAPSGTSYACISQSGTTTGELIWNSSTGALTINGNIFIDGNVTISNAVTYSGTGLIEAAGTVTVSSGVCAANTSCTTNWQGSSGNNSMLSLVALDTGGAATAITMNNTGHTFQGSLWCPSSAQMLINGNSQTLNGPMSVGKIDILGNSPNLEPLPVINGMPTGAPLPPNTGAAVSAPSYVN